MSAKQLLTFISNEVEPVIKDIDGTPHQTKDINKSSLFNIIGIKCDCVDYVEDLNFGSMNSNPK